VSPQRLTIAARTLLGRWTYLAHRPDKMGRIRTRLKGWSKPFHCVYLEICAHCTLECIMCPRHYCPEEPGVMAEEVFEAFRNDILPQAANVMIRGLGEPLLHKDAVRMVEACKASGATVMITTSGVPLERDVARRLVEAGLDGIELSLDAATPETYRTIRRKGDFHRVISNIVALQAVKRHLGRTKPDLFLVPVLTRYVLEELPFYIALSKSLGALGVAFTNPSVWTVEMEKDLPLYPNGSTPHIEAIFAEVLRLGRRHKLNVVLPSLEERETGCTFDVGRNFALTWNGDVRPCCHLFHPTDSIVYKGDRGARQRVSFGNILERRFREIWDSAEYTRFRRAVREGRYPSVCRHCLVRRGL